MVCSGRLLVSEDETIFIPNCFESRKQLSLSFKFRFMKKKISFQSEVCEWILLARAVVKDFMSCLSIKATPVLVIITLFITIYCVPFVHMNVQFRTVSNLCI